MLGGDCPQQGAGVMAARYSLLSSGWSAERTSVRAFVRITSAASSRGQRIRELGGGPWRNRSSSMMGFGSWSSRSCRIAPRSRLRAPPSQRPDSVHGDRVRAGEWGTLANGPSADRLFSGVTAWRWLREWQRAGVWERLHRELLRHLNAEGYIHVLSSNSGHRSLGPV
jgi:hypothetical protein